MKLYMLTLVLFEPWFVVVAGQLVGVNSPHPGRLGQSVSFQQKQSSKMINVRAVLDVLSQGNRVMNN